MAMPSSGIVKKVRRIKLSLDAIESGRFSEFTLSQCCDYIGWLAKFKKVPESVWAPLCEQATRVLESELGKIAY